jgi:teichuronic acid biosynthesis glycosyltransferase TuaH
MPFVVDDLVRSVNPVKIYEYIYFDKPILSIYYPGLERFKKFIDFYINKEECVSIIEKCLISSTKKYSAFEREIFFLENTW